MRRRKPTAVDPKGCGCTECITGEYVPLELATDQQLQDLISGILENHTYVDLDDYEDTYDGDAEALKALKESRGF